MSRFTAFPKKIKEKVEWHYSDTNFVRSDQQLEREAWLIPRCIPFSRYMLMPAAVLIQVKRGFFRCESLRETAGLIDDRCLSAMLVFARACGTSWFTALVYRARFLSTSALWTAASIGKSKTHAAESQTRPFRCRFE